MAKGAGDGDQGNGYYLDYPPSKFSRGGLSGRRPDWDNPHLADVLDLDVAANIGGCATSWESLVHSETLERKFRINNYCHERLFCGVCATSEAHERAATWQEHFATVKDALGLDVAALYFVFTMPLELSERIAQRDDRRLIVNALFTGVHNVFKAAGLLGWVATVHFVSTNNPDHAHIHFPVFAIPATKDGRPVPAFVDREAFAARRRRFLGRWNRELAAVCKRFDLGDHESKNVRLGYKKTVGALAKKLHYEMRPPMQDAFVHGRESVETTRAAVNLALALLYPPGSKTAIRRIRPGGVFGPRAIKKFFGDLGLVREEKPDDAGEWVSEGRAVLLGESGKMCRFLICNTGEVVDVHRDRASTAAHGCTFKWVPAG